MKKFLFCLLAAMMVVPTFVGCGESTEATINPEDKTDDPLNGQSDEDYMNSVNEGMEEAAEQGQ